jgi:hypothetical protein
MAARAKPKAPKHPPLLREDEKIDFLAAAIGVLGGIVPAAKQLEVSRNSIYRWLDNGIGPAAFSTVIKLARLTNVPLDYLARREGPLTPEQIAAMTAQA